jgi:deoxycytidylate deaminase
MSTNPEKSSQESLSNKAPADSVLRDLNANELVFAVVGPIGSGTSWVAGALSSLLTSEYYEMEPNVIKASEAITEWTKNNDSFQIDESSTFSKVTSLQDAGDAMRKSDPAAVAIQLVAAIRKKRLSMTTAVTSTTVTSIKSSEKIKRRVFILDSLKHPAEVELLRAIYKDAFCLIGVVCEEKVRKNRLSEMKCESSGRIEIKKLMDRDEDAEIKYGQKVTETFHLADFFVNNSPARFLEDDEKKIPNPDWDVNEQLARLLDLLTFKKVIRPTPSETGMFHAYGAKMRSACLSRQVGAALLDKKGNVISTGTNEVPRAGGGVYGGSFNDYDHPEEFKDHRCAHSNGFCSSNKSQDEIIDSIISAIPELDAVTDKNALKIQLKKTPIGRLLEFSRAVHAEMDALISAARLGASTVATRLFVTTFPCHYCARHIVSAGVDEVQYIEPYPKSKALKLHGDAITQSNTKWTPPSSLNSFKDSVIVLKENSRTTNSERKVLFRPFTGVAPRLYRQVFLKDRKLKDAEGKFMLSESDSATGLFRLSYQDIEKVLLGEDEK